MSEINWDDMFADAGIKSIDEPLLKQTKAKPNWNNIFNAIDGKNTNYTYDKGLLYIIAKMIPNIQSDNDIVEYYIMNTAFTYNNLFLEKFSSNTEISNNVKWKILTTISPFNDSYRRNWPKSKQDKKDKTIELLKELFPEKQEADLIVLYSFITSKDIKRYQKERGDKC